MSAKKYFFLHKIGMNERGGRRQKKDDVSYTNSSIYFFLELLLSFFALYEALIILQRATRKHIKNLSVETTTYSILDNYRIFAQEYYDSTTFSTWAIYTYMCV